MEQLHAVMNKTTITGAALLFAAIAVVVYWWKQKAAAAASSSTLSNGGQVGSNFSQDLGPEVVRLSLDYARDVLKDSGPCWQNRGSDPERPYKGTLWVMQGNEGLYQWLPQGTFPMTGHQC